MLYSATAHVAGGSGFFFDTDKNTPSDAIKVAQSDVDAAINAPAYSTYSFDAQGVLTITPGTAPVPSLKQARTDAGNAIDVQAGQIRAKYITTVAGQSETYMSKATDAAAYKAASYPVASIASYVWVQAEAMAINGATPTSAQAQAAADSILAARDAWIALGAQIEQARRAGGMAVAAASTVAAVEAAQAAAIAALQAL